MALITRKGFHRNTELLIIICTIIIVADNILCVVTRSTACPLLTRVSRGRSTSRNRGWRRGGSSGGNRTSSLNSGRGKGRNRV